jgi:hypothetical protein
LRLWSADSSVDTEGRAEEVEEIKQAQLKKQKEGKGHWEDGLASDSESIVGLPSALKAHIEPWREQIGLCWGAVWLTGLMLMRR